MLKVSGMWVSPAEIEGVLVEHPAVVEAGVVGLTGHDGLVHPHAAVVLTRGYRAGDALVAELQGWVKARTAGYKVPRTIEFVDDLPKTATGKVQRFRLRSARR
jgi:benzoate-CoA ligase